MLHAQTYEFAYYYMGFNFWYASVSISLDYNFLMKLNQASDRSES
jgi:hypothetical protein